MHRTRTAVWAGILWVGLAAGSTAHGQATTVPPAAGTEQPAAEAGRTPALKQIMADPEWIARSPERAYWSWDGSAVLFDHEREQSRLSDLWRLDLGGDVPGEPVMVADEGLPFVTSRGGAVDADRSWKAFSRSGDIFARNMRTGELIQLTRTTAREWGPMFMADGSVAFLRGGSWVIRDAMTGLEREAADIRAEDQPKDGPKDDDDKDYLRRQQERLFAIVRDRAAREEEREARDEAREDADATRVPGPFYLGDGWRIHERALSPSGRWMVVVASKDPGGEKRDEMPAYVNDDGYVSTSRVRPKVGIEKRREDALFLLDLEEETVTRLKADELPMIADDPLAWLKEKNADESDEEPKAEADAGVAEDADGPDDAHPRPFTVMDVIWSPDGARVAAMLRSNDNKDRWIATVDLAADADDRASLIPIHHLRDEAWINWRYNEMGWTRDARTLWFLSEQTGFGHLYAWEAATGQTRQLTGTDGPGRFTVQDVAESPGGGVLYYRANRDTPLVYELERVDLASGQAEAVTSLGGTVDAFDLSPDGSRVVLEWSTAMDPPELYVQPTRPGSQARRVTQTTSDLFRSFDWVEPEFVAVPSSHADDPIWTRVYDDPAVPAPGPAGKPVVIFAHGAGYTQHVYDGWSFYFREHMFHTLLCRLGYIVLAPDFRASAGYGRDWRTAIYRDMGRPELEDFDDCLAWADENLEADTDNVGIYGGSYGGFLTLMAMFLRPEVYDAGAALRSVTDWAHYNHGYTSNILNTPEIDPEAFERSSPIEHAEGLAGALLMCHGMLDDNVVAQDTIRLAQRLIELEKEDWEMALYPVEPHGFMEPTGWLDEYRRILKLFETHLKD